MKSIILTIAAITAGSQAAAAQTPLLDDQTLRSGYHAFTLADELRRHCPTMTLRLVRAHSFVRDLEQKAAGAGFAGPDIAAASAILRDEVRSELSSRGAQPGNSAGFCTVGREEMARGTEAGRLLQAK